MSETPKSKKRKTSQGDLPSPAGGESENSSAASSSPKIASVETLSDLTAFLEKKFKKLDGKIDVLISHSVEAMMEQISPPLVTSHSAKTRAILDGGDSTWTYMLNGENTLIAVGSVHCGLYYATHSVEKMFVNLPSQVVELGVKRVGFVDPKSIGNPINVHQDIMCVELSAPVDKAGLTGTPPTYEAFHMTNMPTRVAGLSESGIVSGKHCVRDKSGNHLVFVEDFGEAGNSGTLIFGWGKEIKPTPVGTYFGSDVNGGKHLRTRGFIAPLPDYNNFVWYSPLDESRKSTLAVQDKSGLRECQLLCSNGKDCRLQDGSEEWPGVVLKIGVQGNPRIFYCGSADVGSCRCK